jgi:uncharacterized protein with PQ loop repeat
MRSLSFILITFFLAACGNQKIRYVRLKQHSKTEFVNSTTQQPHGSEVKSSFDTPTPEATPTEKEAPKATSETSTEIEFSEIKTPVIFASIPEDSTQIVKRTATENEADIALKAQQNAEISLGLLIAALVGYLLFLFVGIILLIVGASLYNKASKAPYITEDGLNTLSIAKIFLIIDAVLLALITVLIVFLLIVFLL